MEHTRLGYWIEEAGDVTPRPPLDSDRDADLLIVGGGYTGMWTAWHAHRLAPGARIVLLESEPVCGRGPSGRNGGFCEAMWTSLASMRARWGDEPALAVALAAEEAALRIGSFCADEGVDAWYRQGGYLQVSTSPAHDGIDADAIEACRALGVADKLRAVDAAEVQGHCASPAFRAGAIEPITATVQPARLALGLRRRLLEEGVEIYESSPVRRFREAADGVEATDGLRGARSRPPGSAGDRPRRQGGRRPAAQPAHRRLLPHRDHRAGPRRDREDRLDRRRGDHRRPFPRPLLPHHARPADRLRLGRRPDHDGRPPARPRRGRPRGGRRAARPPARLLPRPRRPSRHPRLGGPIDASPTHLPTVTSLPRSRAWVAAGYTGNGVGPTNMVGLTLASLALDRSDDPTRLAFVDCKVPRVPPEPFHWIGGESIRLAIAKKEEAEMANRRPGPISSAIAKIPQMLGFHIGR